MLRHIYPAIQHMPKGERMDGVGADLKRAALAIIREYYMAYYAHDPETKAEHILEMVGWFGYLQAVVEIACKQGVLLARFRLPIAERMERIEEGVIKWNSSTSARRQDPANAPGGPSPSGATGQRLQVKGGGASFTPAADSP